MSGPKTSNYKLTQAQRRALIKQHELERRKGEARAHIIHLTAKIGGLAKLPAEYDEHSMLLAERTGGDNGCSEKKQELQRLAEAELKALSEAGSSKSPDVMERAVKSAQEALKRLTRLRAELDGIAAGNSIQLRTDVVGSVGGADFSSIKTPAQLRLEELRGEVLARLTELSGLELSEALRQNIADSAGLLAEISDEEYMQNFRAMTVIPLEKECRSYSALRESIGGRYDELLARYRALCGERGVPPQGVPFAPGADGRLSALISGLEAEILREKEQSYISASIDEVMEDMGYRLVGGRSVVKKSGRRFRSELYSFSEGTVVNVTYSDSGSITMELGGADSSDRLPDAEETERLTEDMRSFCGKFREFERRLAEKGVTAEHISLLPPEEAYAQVINISDYDMTADVETDRRAEYSGESAKEMSSDE